MKILATMIAIPIILIILLIFSFLNAWAVTFVWPWYTDIPIPLNIVEFMGLFILFRVAQSRVYLKEEYQNTSTMWVSWIIQPFTIIATSWLITSIL